MHDTPSVIDIAEEILQGNPDIGLEDARAQAALRGVKLHPLQPYRAQVRLGLAAPPAPRRKAEEVEEPSPVIQMPAPLLPPSPRPELFVPPVQEAPPRSLDRQLAGKLSTEDLADRLVGQMRQQLEEEARLRAAIEQVIEMLTACTHD